MKTKILISGQIFGNGKLYNALGAEGLIEKRTVFDNTVVLYQTKKAARKALSVAYQSLILGEPDQKGKIGGIRYTRGSSLSYDASTATICI